MQTAQAPYVAWERPAPPVPRVDSWDVSEGPLVPELSPVPTAVPPFPALAPPQHQGPGAGAAVVKSRALPFKAGPPAAPAAPVAPAVVELPPVPVNLVTAAPAAALPFPAAAPFPRAAPQTTNQTSVVHGLAPGYVMQVSSSVVANQDDSVACADPAGFRLRASTPDGVLAKDPAGFGPQAPKPRVAAAQDAFGSRLLPGSNQSSMSDGSRAKFVSQDLQQKAVVVAALGLDAVAEASADAAGDDILPMDPFSDDDQDDDAMAQNLQTLLGGAGDDTDNDDTTSAPSTQGSSHEGDDAGVADEIHAAPAAEDMIFLSPQFAEVPALLEHAKLGSTSAQAKATPVDASLHSGVAETVQRPAPLSESSPQSPPTPVPATLQDSTGPSPPMPVLFHPPGIFHRDDSSEEHDEAEVVDNGHDGFADFGVDGMAPVVDVVPDDVDGSENLSRAATAAVAVPTLHPRALRLRELLAHRDGACDSLGKSYKDLVAAFQREATGAAARAAASGLRTVGPIAFKMKGVPVAKVARRAKVGSRGGLRTPRDLAADRSASVVSCRGPLDPLRPADDAYAAPMAPLVLLRRYACDRRWVSVCEGSVVFEDDGVQFPVSTITPVRGEDERQPLLNLVSLWLLVALGSRYETCATRQLCDKHGAARISLRHARELQDFLFGRQERCSLVLTAEEIKAGRVPVPAPHIPRRRLPNGRGPLTVSAMDLGAVLASSADEPVVMEELPKISEVTGAAQASSRAAFQLQLLQAEEAALAALAEELRRAISQADCDVAAARSRCRMSRSAYERELASFVTGPGAKRRRVPAVDPLGTLLADSSWRRVEAR